MAIQINTDLATLITAAATMVYAVISGLSLWLLSRQIRDARRFGAAPALYALLKALDDHLAAVRQLGGKGAEDATARETVGRCLEFFERIEHLHSAGILPATVLRRAFGKPLQALLADPRFAGIIRQDTRQHVEVLQLAERIGGR